jgi:pyridoxal phosphate enzyme (YggS family)
MTDDRVVRIRENYRHAGERIHEALSRAGRPADSVRIVVVTKGQPLEVVRDAIQAGAVLLGENYAEEAVTKIDALGHSGVEWHMIGHVQSRKAGLVAEHFQMMQSLDSLKLAGKLEQCCARIGKTLPILLEFNVSGEESKFGFPAWEVARWPDLVPVLKGLLGFPHLKLSGLMTMPPFYEEAEKTRPFFKRLRQLQGFLSEQFPSLRLSELSMGTSVDYVTAVEEGATMVRIGTALVGPRSY